MTVVVCSIFRNSDSYIERYFGQIQSLRAALAPEPVRLALSEGDSTDWTWTNLLTHITPQDELARVEHGGPHFGSVDNPARWEQISRVVRPTVAAALELRPDVVVWVESDLIWETGAMVKLIETARQGRAVAPMVMAAGEERFYDVWGFRLRGNKFSPGLPYFPADPNASNDADSHLRKIDSCGSCFATPDMHALRWWDGHWPYRNGDEQLWIDPTVEVIHP